MSVGATPVLMCSLSSFWPPVLERYLLLPSSLGFAVRGDLIEWDCVRWKCKYCWVYPLMVYFWSWCGVGQQRNPHCQDPPTTFQKEVIQHLIFLQ